MERLAAPSLGVLQPLAGAAMAIGLTLLVVNTLPLGQSATGSAAASPGAAPVPEAGGLEPTAQAAESAETFTDTGGSPVLGAVPSPAPTGYRTAAGPNPSPTSESLVGPVPAASADEGIGTAGDQGRERLALETSGPDWLVIGILLIIAGLAIFLARVLAVRQMRDPRLQ
jgi:hypothetical protein